MAVIDPSAVWDFAREVVGVVRPDRGRTLATVTRVDPDGTTWVTTGDGGEAPAASVGVGVSVGDTVTLEWDGSAMGIRANVSDPAPPGSSIRRAVTRAQGVASAAQRVADAVNQHFFADDNGIHVTEATQDEWDTNHSGANVLINSIGQLFRDGLNNLLTLTTEDGARALIIWDGLGNAASNVLASFSADGVGLVGDAFRLSSSKTSEDYGDESDPHVVEQVNSAMRMEQANEHYTVRSHIDTELSTGDSTVGYTYGGFDFGLTVEDDQGEEIKRTTFGLYAEKTDSAFLAYADDIELHGTSDVLLTGRSFRVADLQGGENTWSTAPGTILWSGVYYMTETQTATLSRNLSTCPTGIVLHWQAYENGSAANNSHVYSFVPKAHPAGEGMLCPMAAANFAYVGSKYVYVYNNRVVGNTHNDNRQTIRQDSSVNLTGNSFYIRSDRDIHDLAVEIATLTRTQQRGRGLRMA